MPASPAALVHSPPLVIPEVLVAGPAGPVPGLTGLEGARHPAPEASGLRVLAAVPDRAEVPGLTVEEPGAET